MKKLMVLLISLILLLLCLLNIKRDDFLINSSHINKVKYSNKLDYAYAKTKEKKDDYLLTLEIPKINLKREVYQVNSDKNNVDLNVKILKESDMPDKENGSIFLAAHRGNTKVSYFENLHKLVNGDKVFVYYNDKKYEYTINNSFLTEKDGEITFNLNANKKSIALITCVKEKSDKQIVFIGYSS